ncbi:MAG: hypothetical protein O6940_01850 [Ignavibacteria bacterium]|nr:hypothetical protein [Ignavibacteria bacterium]
MRIKNLLISGLLSLLLTLVILNSCGGDEKENEGKSGNIPEPDNSTYDVEYTENTKVVNDDVVEMMISSDKKSGVYKFNAAADELMKLEKGNVVIFAGHSVRKIKSVNKSGSEIIVNTEYATLNEAIKNGTIAWETEINWSSDQPEVKNASLIMGDAIFASETTSELKIHFEGKIKGWEVSLDLKPEDNKLSIEITGSKSIKGQKVCTIDGKGFISNFTNQSEITFANSELQNYEYYNKGLKGELEIKFAAVGLGSEIAQLVIPAKISIPYRIGLIPVNFNLKANLKIYPEVRKGASSQASYKLTYDSDMGFKFAEGETNVKSELKSQEMEVTGETVSAGAVTTGVGVGFEFPRFEIAVFGELVVPYFLYNTSVTTFYEPGLLSNVPPCQEGKMTLKCVSGIDLKFFGVSYAYSKTHFEKEKKWQTEGSRCED